ncbi:MAG: Crp/Fnr family transcriptional regulator [Sphingobacteriales bacterium]|nr:MAG: Crp/Fnr family transcriptional regulator [Sphingobacteriales bacterium]
MWNTILKSIGRHIQLTAEEVEYFTSLLTVRKLRKRQYLLQEGDVMRLETFVSKGCLRSYEIDAKGQEHIIQFSVEEWWVGDMYSFLTGTPSRLNIDCLEDTEVIQFSKDQLEELYVRVPKFERYFRLLVQNAYIASQNRILSIMTKPALERYHEFLQKYPTIEQRVPNHQIASFLGITPESLSRLRKQYASGKPLT